MAAKKKTAPKKSQAKSRSRKAQDTGEHARKLAPASAVRAIINEIIATKNATSEAGQGLSTAAKRFNELGGNLPAVRIAGRIYSKAKQDGLKARVLWEDLVYYLTECTDFDKIAPTGMFTPAESGQTRREDDDDQAETEAEGGHLQLVS
jgi:hypothetical protein